MSLIFYPEPEGSEKECRDRVRAYVNQAIRPFAIADDEASHFRREAFVGLCREGFSSMILPKIYGGQGGSSLDYYVCLEEIARASLAMSVVVGVTNLVQGALLAYGTTEQKDGFLPKLASGEWLGAFSLSEPQSGSDAASLRCRAQKTEGGYLVTGNKVWCSNAGHADLYLLMARTGEHKTRGVTAFLIPSGTAGFRVGKMEKKMGLRGSSLAELIFEDCFVADSQRLGKEGSGLTVALSQLDAGRITIGTVGAGLAVEALERAWRLMKAQQEYRFGEGTQHCFGHHYARTQAVKLLVREAARKKDKKEKLTVIAAQAKLLGSDLAMQVTDDVCHFMGEWGTLREFEFERLMRDAKALQIVEGTNQIQRLVLAREMGSMLT